MDEFDFHSHLKGLTIQWRHGHSHTSIWPKLRPQAEVLPSSASCTRPNPIRKSRTTHANFFLGQWPEHHCLKPIQAIHWLGNGAAIWTAKHNPNPQLLERRILCDNCAQRLQVHGSTRRGNGLEKHPVTNHSGGKPCALKKHPVHAVAARARALLDPFLGLQAPLALKAD